MAELIANQWASDSGHWYDREGKPAYEVTGANGRRRNTTLADAKKMGLYPSVSTILKMEAAPALEAWKIKEAVKAAMSLRRDPNESDDEFVRRAIEASKEQTQEAAARGTYLHGLLEESVRSDRCAGEPEIIEPALTWLRVNFGGYTWNVERSFASPLHYGGKVDLYGTDVQGNGVIIDWKAKDGIIEGKRLAYDNHVTQLGAYSRGLNMPQARCINLFIDSYVPGVIVAHEWKPHEVETGYLCFLSLLSLWEYRKGLRTP